MFVNTMDKFGDKNTMNMIIDGTITEYCDNTIEHINGSFFGRTNLTIVDVPNATSIGATTFQGCSNLSDVNIPSVTRLNARTFADCASLAELCLPSVSDIPYSNTGGTFESCIALKYIDLPVCVKISADYVFANCNALVVVILRNITTVCELGTANVFINTPIASGKGYIYVPRALIDSYKVATNWSEYAAQFRVLEDYTIDGTVTGKFDKSKVEDLT